MEIPVLKVRLNKLSREEDVVPWSRPWGVCRSLREVPPDCAVLETLRASVGALGQLSAMGVTK